MAESALIAGLGDPDTPCQCTSPDLSEFSRFSNRSYYPIASKGEIIRSWLATHKYTLKYAPLHHR